MHNYLCIAKIAIKKNYNYIIIKEIKFHYVKDLNTILLHLIVIENNINFTDFFLSQHKIEIGEKS